MSIPQTSSQLLEMGFAFCRSKVLLSAVEMEVFTLLGVGTMSGEELRAGLGLHPRATFDFLDSLVALGLLERDGDGPDGRYRNTPATAQFLDRKGPEYIGSLLELCNARTYNFWSTLTDALKTGRPQNETKHGRQSMFEVVYQERQGLERFLDSMAVLSRANFEALAEKFDFSSYGSVCDIGGATGLLSRVIARRHPHIRCTTFDLPKVEPIVMSRVHEDGLADRIDVVSGDFFRDPLPNADLITMGMILHDWNLEKKKLLIKAAYDALPKGGALIAIDRIIDDARRENAAGLLMSLHMLIEFGDAFDYTRADFWGWCREVGFERHASIALKGGCSAAIAYK